MIPVPAVASMPAGVILQAGKLSVRRCGLRQCALVALPAAAGAGLVSDPRQRMPQLPAAHLQQQQGVPNCLRLTRCHQPLLKLQHGSVGHEPPDEGHDRQIAPHAEWLATLAVAATAAA